MLSGTVGEDRTQPSSWLRLRMELAVTCPASGGCAGRPPRPPRPVHREAGHHCPHQTLKRCSRWSGRRPLPGQLRPSVQYCASPGRLPKQGQIPGPCCSAAPNLAANTWGGSHLLTWQLPPRSESSMRRHQLLASSHNICQGARCGDPCHAWQLPLHESSTPLMPLPFTADTDWTAAVHSMQHAGQVYTPSRPHAQRQIAASCTA